MERTTHHSRNHDNRNDRSNRDEREREDEAPPIHSVKVFSEESGKRFFLDLKENHRGVFLRIKEVQKNGRRPSIIMVPVGSIPELSDALAEIENHIP